MLYIMIALVYFSRFIWHYIMKHSLDWFDLIAAIIYLLAGG